MHPISDGAEPNAPDPARPLDEAIDDFGYEWDVLTHRVKGSPSLLQLLGDAGADDVAAAEWWFDKLHADDLVSWRERLAGAFADRTCTRIDGEYRVRRHDGQYATMIDHARLLRDETLRVVRVIGTLADVSTFRRSGIDRVHNSRTSGSDPVVDVDRVRRSSASTHADQYEAERRMRERAEQLQHLAGALARALTREQVAAVIVDSVRDALGAFAAAVFALTSDEREFALLASLGMPSGVAHDFARFDVERSLPIREAFLTRVPVFIESWQQWNSRFAEAPRVAPEGGRSGAWAALPLLVDDVLRGVLTLAFPSPRDFSAEDRAYIQAFADQCAQGLDRASAYEAVTSARQRAERSAARLTALHAASIALGSAMTPRAVAEAALSTALPALGATRGVLALLGSDGDTLEVVGDVGFAETTLAPFRRTSLKTRFPLADVVRERKTMYLPSAAARHERYPDLGATIDANGNGAMASVPLLRGTQVLGAFGVNWTDLRESDSEDIAFLEAMAEQCAQALERAALFDGERRARARGEMILNSIQDGFVAFDHAFRFTYVNRRAEEILQLPAAHLLGRAATEIFPQYADSPFTRVLREALTTRRARMVEGFVAPVGAWTEARIYPTDDGASVFIQDVTERRRNEESNRILAVASAMLSEANGQGETCDAIVRATVPSFADWVILDGVAENGALHRLTLGTAKEEQRERMAELDANFGPGVWAPLGAPTVFVTGSSRLLDPITRDVLLALLRGEPNAAAHADALLQLGLTSAICVPLVAQGRTTGVLTLVSTSVHRRYSEDDLPLARELATRAATALAKAQSLEAERTARGEAEAARRDAEEANRAKMDFLTAMSHELRTPLNAIGGYAEILSLGLRGPVTDEQRQDLARIEGNQRHLLGLINDVLNYAKLDAGKVEYTIVDVELRTAMSAVESLIAPQLKAKSLRFLYGVCDDEVVVRADAEKVRQILMNLLSNAVKYTANGGEIEISCAREGSFGVLRVRDTGVGIETSKLEHIFEPFVQLGRTLTSRTEGTGLGLAISRDLARAMGGDLSAESSVNVGSTFTLTLPGR